MTGHLNPTRRTAIAFGGFLVAALALPATAHADPPPLDPLTATESGSTSVFVPGDDQTIQLPRDLGVTVSGPLPAGAELNLVFDPRVYTQNENPLATHDGKNVGVETTTPTAGTIIVTFTEAVPAGTVSVVAGQLSSLRYPHDIVRDLKGLSAEKKGRGKALNPPKDLSKKKATVKGEPWGAECAAMWDQIVWGEGNRYYWPLSASIRSTGPGPIPPDSIIRVLCDAAIVRTLKVTGASDSVAGQVAGSFKLINIPGVTGVEWTTKSEVAAGSQVLLTLESTVKPPLQDLEGVKNPIVEFLGAKNSLETQRTTYRESVHRADVIVNAEMRESVPWSSAKENN